MKITDMKIMMKVLLFLSLMAFFVRSEAQSSYKITVKSNGFKDTVLYLGYYYGKFQYAKDTARFDSKGVAIFEKKNKTLERGVYFIVFPNKKHLDFIVNNEQIMTFEVDTTDIVRKTKISGSKENQLFYNYNKEMADVGVEYEKLRISEERLKDSNSDSLEIIRDEMKKLNDLMQQKRDDFVKQNPGALVSKIFLLTKDPQLPEPPLKDNGKPDSAYLYTYFKDNYWMNMDFTDDALVRTPVFHARLERFISQVVIQHPDSVTSEIDKLISKTEQTPELFKYVVWFLTFHYETSQIMGHDAVFVHMVDKYYKTGKAFWASEAVLTKIIQRADKIRPILIGSFAPNMALLDTTLKSYIQLWSIQAAYTVMIFWDPDCGHCKKEVEKVNKFYIDEGKMYDMKVYSICTDTSLTRWKEKIKEKEIEHWINVNGTRSALGNYQELYDVFATPLIFILDKDKKIIAKKIGAENVSYFIKQTDATKPKENESPYENH
jgi:hypothetical protein